MSAMAKQKRRRLAWAAGAFFVALALAIILAPQGHLSCDEPYVTETSPDGHWSLTVCGRPVFMIMPGGGSDAPGWIVLRDEAGAIRGVSSLSMLQLYGGGIAESQTEWTPSHVRRTMVFNLALRPAYGTVDRWLEERIWRLRALTGLVPSDEALW
jgi:hypothetical protein